MLVSEVMHRLNTEQQIQFLLTAYLESLQYYDTASHLPPGVATLPLNGMADIEARFSELLGAELCGLARSNCDTRGAIAREATQIFGAASTRLQALRQSANAPAARADAHMDFLAA